MRKIVTIKTNKRKDLVFEFEESMTTDPCFKCPYSGICGELPNPEKRSDLFESFADFCIVQNSYVPVPGSLEKYYGRMIEKIKEEV